MTRKVAVVAWGIREIRTESEFFDHLAELIGGLDADWIVLPEFFSFELLHTCPSRNSEEQMEFLGERFETIVAELTRLSRGRTIVGGSHISAPSGVRQNLCPMIVGDKVSFQEKLKMTQFESKEMEVSGGDGLIKPQDALSTLVCYDCEFPEAGRVLCEAGALALAVPAFTETRRGFQRVRWSCQARAIENQVFVLHSSLVGALGFEPVPITYGSSAILTPSVEPFPESSILAETPLNKEAIAEAVLDFNQLAECRESGDVRNWNDRTPEPWRFV